MRAPAQSETFEVCISSSKRFVNKDPFATRLYYLKSGSRYYSKMTAASSFLEDFQWCSRDEIRDHQNQKLRKIIRHAYHNVEYYRSVMNKAGLKPDDIRCVEDLRNLPVLTKEIVKANHTLLRSKGLNMKEAQQRSTGGSTGEPLSYLQDGNSLAWREATSLRGMSWAGYRMGDPYVSFMTTGKPSFLGKIRGRIVSRHYFPAFAKESEVIRSMRMLRLRPSFFLASYASNLYRIAMICKKHAIRDLPVKALFSTGEMLYDHQRQTIAKIFGCSTYDYYGCNEVGTIAHECEHQHKHVSDERFFLEITNAQESSQNESFGEVTVTDFDNYAMPFIRYQVGDVASLSDDRCQCGRQLTLLNSVAGRRHDFLISEEGERVPAVAFPTIFRSLRGLDQYQIIQVDRRNITLKIVKNKAFSSAELSNMVDVILRLVGSSVSVCIEEHQTIPLTARGKERLVMSCCYENDSSDGNGELEYNAS